MELLIKGRISIIANYNNCHTTLFLSEEDLLKLHEAISFHYFDQDFHNFLELQHESACFSDGCKLSTLKKFWKLYKDAQDMNIAEWDTFSNIYEAAKSIDGFWWTCSHCGCDVFGEFPQVDADGNVYCDDCDENYMGYCDYCDGKYDYETKLYFVGQDKRICEECLRQSIEK